MGSGDIALAFMTSTLDGGEWTTSLLYRFISGERAPSTYWIGGWVGPRAGLDDVEKRNADENKFKKNITVEPLFENYKKTRS
jgi:hypothetical protein